MKKILLMLISLLVLVGCSNKGSEENYHFNDETILKINEIALEQEQIFSNGDIMDKDTIPELYFNVDDFDELYLNISKSSDDPSSYIVALPKDGKEKLCQAQIDAYIQIVASSYKDYNPTAEKVIEDRMDVMLGNYIVTIISNDNEKVLQDIKKIAVTK